VVLQMGVQEGASAKTDYDGAHKVTVADQICV
jgi:hypothetical protein